MFKNLRQEHGSVWIQRLDHLVFWLTRVHFSILATPPLVTRCCVLQQNTTRESVVLHSMSEKEKQLAATTSTSRKSIRVPKAKTAFECTATGVMWSLVCCGDACSKSAGRGLEVIIDWTGECFCDCLCFKVKKMCYSSFNSSHFWCRQAILVHYVERMRISLYSYLPLLWSLMGVFRSVVPR